MPWNNYYSSEFTALYLSKICHGNYYNYQTEKSPRGGIEPNHLIFYVRPEVRVLYQWHKVSKKILCSFIVAVVAISSIQKGQKWSSCLMLVVFSNAISSKPVSHWSYTDYGLNCFWWCSCKESFNSSRKLVSLRKHNHRALLKC